MANSLLVGPIAKPEIRLVGDRIGTTRTSYFAEKVDHAKYLKPTFTMVIGGGVTQFDQEDLLTFSKNVRVIITTPLSPRPNYAKAAGSEFNSLTFEGKSPRSTYALPQSTHQNLNYVETYYTLNGKDPIRTKASVYVYRDWSDVEDYDNPSDDLAQVYGNIATLGFILSSSPTGSDYITLKAKSYQDGKESRVAIARFRIVAPQNYTSFASVETALP